MNNIINKFTLEEIYLIRSCNLKTPDKNRIKSELNDYLDLEGMKELVSGVLDKLESVTEEELQKIWEFSLD